MPLSVGVNLTGKPRSQDISWGQKVRRESACRGGATVRRGGSAGAGGGAGLTSGWFGLPRGLMALQNWGVEGSYGQGYKRARERVVGRGSNVWKRGSLAGPIEQCLEARGRVGGILRTVLRSTLRAVLRRAFRAVLRNEGVRGVQRGGEWGQDATARP